MTNFTDMTNPMGPDDRDDDFASDPVAGGEVPREGEASTFAAGVQRRARALADRIALEVQEHPIRSLAVAGLIGFLIASSMKYRTIPAMLRSGAGIAAAMALREIAERGLSRLDVD